MTDPLSIVVGVTGIATATLQSSKTLFELVRAIKGCSEEVKGVFKDVHTLYSITYSLNAILKERAVLNAISNDEALLETLTNLFDPLSNCQAILGQIMLKIQRNVRASSDGNGYYMNLKWALLTKDDVKTLKIRLEAAKATMNSALGALTMFCNIRSLAATEHLAARITNQKKMPEIICTETRPIALQSSHSGGGAN